MAAGPRKKSADSEAVAEAPSAAVPNAVRQPKRKGFLRDKTAKVDAGSPPGEELRGLLSPTGRDFSYEWEVADSDLDDRIRLLELGGGGGGGLRFVHTQVVASASWSINHALTIKPDVTVLAVDGQELYAEIRHPDNNNTVIIFGSPYAGTAILRG